MLDSNILNKLKGIPAVRNVRMLTYSSGIQKIIHSLLIGVW